MINKIKKKLTCVNGLIENYDQFKRNSPVIADIQRISKSIEAFNLHIYANL